MKKFNFGEMNSLYIRRSTEPGLYLALTETEEDREEVVLLPNKYITSEMKVGQLVDVFLYFDSEDRPIATTLTPKVQLGEFAYLEVKETTQFGSFVDWGLEKDLFVPFREQKRKMIAGRHYIVFLYIDGQTDRLTGSAKLEQFFEVDKVKVNEGDKVSLLVWEHSDIGIKVIVNNCYKGLVYDDSVYEDVNIGDRKDGYVAKVREDKKLDITFQAHGLRAIDVNTERILTALKENEGYLPLNDKSSPDEVSTGLQMSKKSFKKAIGALYKGRQINIESDGIRLL